MLVDTYVSVCYHIDVQTVLQAIAEPRRREIMLLLRSTQMTAGEVASHFTITRPAISQHLGVLKAAGLVVDRREGTRRVYSARPEGLMELRSFLEVFWNDSLARLKQAAEAEERRTTNNDDHKPAHRTRDPHRGAS